MAHVRVALGIQCAAAVAAGYAITKRASERADDTPSDTPEADKHSPTKVLRAAEGIISACHSYGFVCTPGDGKMSAPDCRIMDLHWLDARNDKGPTSTTLDFCLVSRSFTRKAKSLSGGKQCTIAFHDPRMSGENGYVSLSGCVRELADADERRAKWKPSWSFFHPGPHNPDVAMWHFVPDRVEVISHANSVSKWWSPVTMVHGVQQRDSAEQPTWILQATSERQGSSP
jgi:general stress protein 26